MAANGSAIALQTDESQKLMENVLGTNWDALINIANAPGGVGVILGNMFNVLNTAFLLLTIVIAVWWMLVAVINTSHQGNIGQRYGGPWSPLRIVFAIAFNAPAFSGFSALQVVILFFAGFGIWTANQTFAVASSYVSTVGGISAATVPGPKNAALALMQGAVCMTYANGPGANDFRVLSAQGGDHVKLTYIDKTVDGVRKVGIAFDGVRAKGLPDGLCGSVSITCSASSSTPTESASICSSQKTQLNILLGTAFSVANAVVNNSVIPASASVDAALGSYVTNTSNAIQTAITSANAGKASELSALSARMSVEGWASIGQWYLPVLRVQERINEQISEQVSATAIMGNKFVLSQRKDLAVMDSRLNTFLVNDGGTGVKTGLASAGSAAYAEAGGDIGDKVIEAASTSITGDIVSSVVANLTTGDPILSLAGAGHTIATAGWGAIAGIMTVVGIANGGKGQIAGKAVDLATGAFSAIGGIMQFIGGLLLALIGAIIVAGYGLAYYLPAVPWIVWTLAVVGWGMSVAMMLVSAPMWGLAMALPEGEGIAGAFGKEGFLAVLGIIIRPPLMVISFIIMLGLLVMGTRLVGHGFGELAEGLVAGKLSFIGSIAFLVVMLFVILMKLVHLSASLIYRGPDFAMQLIGSRIGDQTTGTYAQAIDAGVSRGGSSGEQGIRGGVAGANRARQPRPKTTHRDVT